MRLSRGSIVLTPEEGNHPKADIYNYPMIKLEATDIGETDPPGPLAIDIKYKARIQLIVFLLKDTSVFS